MESHNPDEDKLVTRRVFIAGASAALAGVAILTLTRDVFGSAVPSADAWGCVCTPPYGPGCRPCGPACCGGYRADNYLDARGWVAPVIDPVGNRPG